MPLTRANATEAVDAGRSVRISVQVSNPADKRDERVLDFTNYTGDPFSPYDPALESNRGGDDFWVLVK